MRKRIFLLSLSLLLILCGCGPSRLLPATPEPPEMRLTTPPPTATPSPTPEPTPESTPVPPPEFGEITPAPTPWLKPIGAFSIEDMRVDDVPLDASIETVEEVFGEPLVREPYTEPATGASFVTLGYDEEDGIFFHFLQGRTLTRATLTTSAHAGPRGLRVGDSYERVLSVFVRDPEVLEAALTLPNEEDAEPLYLYGELDSRGGVYAPMGMVDPFVNKDYGSGEFIVRFLDPSRPYTEEERELGTSQFVQHGACVFFIDAEELTVLRINWTYSALAE